MRWSELDLDRALWSLPGARTKNGKPHVVPLSEPAVALLRARESTPECDNAFGNPHGAYSG
jgi:integrase